VGSAAAEYADAGAQARPAITRTLRWLSVGVWAYYTLAALGVTRVIWSAGEVRLTARYVRGSISLSLGDVVAFVLTVVGVFGTGGKMLV
jgi:hypothetical protein